MHLVHKVVERLFMSLHEVNEHLYRVIRVLLPDCENVKGEK